MAKRRFFGALTQHRIAFEQIVQVYVIVVNLEFEREFRKVHQFLALLLHQLAFDDGVANNVRCKRINC